MEFYQEGETNSDPGGALDESYAFNIEHILPQRESENWNIAEQTAQQFRKRLGNMILMNPNENVKLGSKAFSHKRKVYAKSPLLLTQKVAEFIKWGPAEIDKWQEDLAELAVSVWPSK